MIWNRPARIAPLVVAALLAGLAVAAVVLLSAHASRAAVPAAQAVTVPAAGGSASAAWTGTIAPGSNPLSDCDLGFSASDQEKITFTVPAGLYDAATAQATFKIEWTPSSGDEMTSDEILTVDDPDGNEVASADTSNTTEELTVNDPKAGTYTVKACGFLNVSPQPYKGSVTVVTKLKGAPTDPDVPSSGAQGLEFSAAVPTDNQRDESEPLVEVAPDGRIYTCGPTGFSQASDYAQVSTDGGDQFHLLGTPPRGQQGLGGGGDCALATGVQPNALGQFQYSYAGLGPLTGFTTSTSADSGHSIANAGPQGNGTNTESVGDDRQWTTFLDDKTVLMAYNGQAPRQIVVQRSTDGGLTYDTGHAASPSNLTSNGPDFPGPMRSMPAGLALPGLPAGSPRIAYFSWTYSDSDNAYVNLAVSKDGGNTWNDCNLAKVPAATALQAFTVADNDDAGNLYVSFGTGTSFHTYLTTLTADKLAGCTGTVTGDPAAYPNPGASAPVQVDRDRVRSTVFPWLVAEGKPGNVAFTYYGTETDGDAGDADFKASWDVYVNELSDALSNPNPVDRQVKASTHPVYYDQICLGGLGCETGGDRTLGDFLSIDYNRVTDKLSVVFNDPNKLPDQTGNVSTPMLFTQIGGPTLSGGSLTPTDDRVALRTSAADPGGDALIDYSMLGLLVAPSPPNTRNEPAMDFTSVAVGPQLGANGATVPDGGFTATMKVADLSNAALSNALADTNGNVLLWILKFKSGYQHVAVSARYDGSAFSFAFDPYTTDLAGCGGGRCVTYPGTTTLTGKVDQGTGTIQVNVPRALLKELAGPTGTGQRPVEQKAAPGTRFYDGTAFSLASTTPDVGDQSFLYPADNTRAMDFLLPGLPAGQSRPGVVSPTPGAGSASTRGARQCLDRLPPRTTLKRSGMRRGHGRLRFRGRSYDRGCDGKISRKRGNRVYVSVAKVGGRHKCRFERRNGRLTRKRSCRKALFLRARGGSPRWSKTVSARRLPKGKYRAVVRAIDKSRNKETPNKRGNSIRFRLR
jgi:hypothetical protein